MPTTMERELVDLADRNLREATREMATWSGQPEIGESPGLLLVAGAARLPIGYANAAFPVAVAECPARDLVERARRFFGERKRGYTLWTRTYHDLSIQDAARRAGLQRIIEMPGLVLDAPLPEPSLPAGASLQVVENAGQAGVFADVATRAFAALSSDPLAGSFAVPERLLRPHVIALLATVDGEPAATALAVLSDGVAGLYWVGTMEGHRGRGLGEACTRRAGNAAFARGARAVTLQATRQGEPIYRRMGYREITRYTWYVDFQTEA
jgi:ribosomal protein S18 acetylase RimI-like enzyme